MIMKIEAVSTKHQTVLIDGKWRKVDPRVDLSQIRAKNEYNISFNGNIISDIQPKKEDDLIWVRKDWRITRLAAVDRAIQYLAATGEDFSVEKVLEIADRFVEYAYDESMMKSIAHQ